MKTGDLITSYLSNEMNPEQEREFLLSVAASDSLRLALKSHVMLDRIVTRQAQQVHVPEAIRENIFAQMSASMPGTSHGASASHPSAISGTGGGGQTAGLFGRSIWKFGRGAMVMVMTACSFAAGYYVHSQLPESASQVTATQAVAAPDVKKGEAPEMVPQTPASDVTTGAVKSTAAGSAGEASPSVSRQGRVAVNTASVPLSRQMRTMSAPQHGLSVTGSEQNTGSATETIQQSAAPAETTVPASQTPDQPVPSSPLNPAVSSKSTVTSGAQSSSETQPKNNVTLDGSILDSHGNPQRALPQEGPK